MPKPDPRPQPNLFAFLGRQNKDGISGQQPSAERKHEREGDVKRQGKSARDNGSSNGDCSQHEVKGPEEPSDSAAKKLRISSEGDSAAQPVPGPSSSTPPKDEAPKKLFPLFRPRAATPTSNLIDLTQSPSPVRPIAGDSFIVIPDSPKTFADFSAARARSKPPKKKQLHAPWPRPGEQHINYVVPSESNTSNLHTCRRRRALPLTDSYDGFDFLSSRPSAPSRPPIPPEVTFALPPPEVLQHPLLLRLSRPFIGSSNPPPRDASCDVMWATKYAPACAEEVLGAVSQQSSRTLRDWLRELAIGCMPPHRNSSSFLISALRAR
jgi:hypothetical protein